MSDRPVGWSLRRRVPQVLSASLALLVVLIIVLGFALLQVKDKGDEVINRWDPATLAGQGALSAMVNQETGLRGYAVAQQDEFLEPYREYQAPEVDAERELRGYLAGDAELLSLLAAFHTRVDEWHTQVAEPFIARVAAGDPTVADDAISVQTKASFDRLRVASAALTRATETRRDEAEGTRTRAFAVVWAVAGAGVVLLLAAGFGLVLTLRRTVLDPISSLVAQTQEVASGRLGQTIVPSGPREIVGLGADVDAMRVRLVSELGRVERGRQRATKSNDDLARSNADLEQFAYVASHDLSEPLRKVTNFCQLLERQYADQLDDRARTYMGFMVDGAKRMQILINDLLAFSRVSRSNDNFAPVDLGQALTRALTNLETRIEAAGGVVEADPLPTVPGDLTLLTALLQNLVSNAVKYHDPERSPRVRITARQVDEVWEVSVTDNGIGIEPQYAERIFAIFQRLHLRGQYDGTGIGLALCRKIVDFHGGAIWLAGRESGPELQSADAPTGSCFRFTLPLRQAPRDDLDDDPELTAGGSFGVVEARAEPKRTGALFARSR